MKRKLNGLYITNLSPNIKSGGWSGMNVNVYQQLTNFFEISYSNPINPPVFKFEQIVSKLKAVINQKRYFEYFSERRLNEIADQCNKQLNSDADFLFFHGTTPWIKSQTHLPYYAYVDATFLTYLDIYLDPRNFNPKEITRIVKQETIFLSKASGIFFSSEWARQNTINRYHLDGHNFHTVGLGGNSQIGLPDFKKGSRNLLFVSMDFKRKGGFIAYEAFCKLKNSFPELKLNIVGDKPSEAIINDERVVYHDFIDKNTEEGQKQFDDIFKDSCFLIHPTEKDMTPLIIVEAGNYGIPAIAPKRFGIPEMIIEGKTGFLLNENTSNEICTKVKTIIQDQELLAKMSLEAFKHITKVFNWENVGYKITQIINAKYFSTIY